MVENVYFFPSLNHPMRYEEKKVSMAFGSTSARIDRNIANNACARCERCESVNDEVYHTPHLRVPVHEVYEVSPSYASESASWAPRVRKVMLIYHVM